MQSQILFLTDGSYQDAVAHSVLCYYAQKTKTPITVIFANQRGYHDKITDGFRSNATVKFVSRINVAASSLDTFELDQLDVQFVTIHDLCMSFNIPRDVELAAVQLSMVSDYWLPSFMGNILLHRMGFIEFGNFVAQRWLEDVGWDIVRDQEVIDTVAPPRVDHVVVS